RHRPRGAFGGVQSTDAEHAGAVRRKRAAPRSTVIPAFPAAPGSAALASTAASAGVTARPLAGGHSRARALGRSVRAADVRLLDLGGRTTSGRLRRRWPPPSPPCSL